MRTFFPISSILFYMFEFKMFSIHVCVLCEIFTYSTLLLKVHFNGKKHQFFLQNLSSTNPRFLSNLELSCEVNHGGEVVESFDDMTFKNFLLLKRILKSNPPINKNMSIVVPSF
jgi:hypothetical protein